MRYLNLLPPSLALCLAFMLSACVAQPPVEQHRTISRAQLLQGERFDLDAGRTLPPVDITAVNDEMRAFVHERVPAGAGDKRKVEIILAAILEEGLHLDYNNLKTYTAAEAFYQREGNCLSFTNLFVALAREAGVNVHYQEVEVPATWVLSGSTYMYNLHVNALVKLPGTEQIVDFNLDAYDKEFHRRQISDQTALAQYHNNMGVHWLSQNQPEQAFLHLQVALELRSHTGYFWTNLGTIYRRAGYFAEAEEAYLVAIDVDSEPVAMSNLARLYRQQGQTELANYYKTRVELFRHRNPYYLFHLAEEAYADAHYPEAVSLLRRAIRQRKNEHDFHRLLGLSYLQLGDSQAAQRRFLRAAELAETAQDRERYNHKLELLAGSE